MPYLNDVRMVQLAQKLDISQGSNVETFSSLLLEEELLHSDGSTRSAIGVLCVRLCDLSVGTTTENLLCFDVVVHTYIIETDRGKDVYAKAIKWRMIEGSIRSKETKLLVSLARPQHQHAAHQL